MKVLTARFEQLRIEDRLVLPGVRDEELTFRVIKITPTRVRFEETARWRLACAVRRPRAHEERSRGDGRRPRAACRDGAVTTVEEPKGAWHPRPREPPLRR